MFNVFLQILDDARLTDNRGLTVSFRDTVIIMTTNIGTNHFLDPNLERDVAVELAMTDLSSQYRPEFLNRFNGRRNIVCFNKLELPIIEKIAKREIEKLNQRIQIKSSELQVQMPAADLSAMCAAVYEPINGARGLTGYIADVIKPSVADVLLKSPDTTGTISVTFNTATNAVEISVPREKATSAVG